MQVLPLRKIIVCLAAAGILLVAGCEDKPARSPGPSSPEKPLVGVLIYKKDDVYIATVTRSLAAGLDGKAEVSVQYAEEDQLAQNEQLESLLQKKAAAIALNQVDIQAAAQTLDRIKKAGIPVIYFNREPDMATVRSYDKARFVGTTILDAGKMQGELIAGLWRAHPEYDRNGDGKCQYIMFQGNADNPEAVARTEYSVRQARENGLAIQQVGQTFICNWDRELAARAMEFALAQHGEAIECIIANNDSMALGAIDVLQKHGRNLEGKPETIIPVVGVDAIDEAVAAIEKGIMSATVKQDGDAMGKAIATLLLNALAGKDFLEGLPYAWDESGIAVRIPYAPFEGTR
jgi:methyl-galactoside transport system substrate-binding protein